VVANGTPCSPSTRSVAPEPNVVAARRYVTSRRTADSVLATDTDFAGALSKGAHVAIEGEIRSHEYQREVAVGTQRTSIPQRVWEIRVDSVLKLDRAAKRESNDDSHEEVPR
jgi:hypothetical protein